MKMLGVATALILAIVAGIAVVLWLNHAPARPIQQEGLTSATSAMSTAPTGMLNATSKPSLEDTAQMSTGAFTRPSTNITTSGPEAIGAPMPSPSTSTTSPAGWATFTNAEDLYSIQYPNTFGEIYISYGGFTRETVLNIGGYEVDISFLDDPEGLTLEQWFDQKAGTPGQVAPPTETVSVNGLNGIIVPVAGEDGSVGGYLYASSTEAPIIYGLRFSCSGYCLPPPFWRQMLNSFQVLPPDQQTLIGG